jgi:deoxyribodipyrimidine photolyase
MACPPARTAQVKRQEAKRGSEQWADSASAFLRQLGYRDYARYLSFHFPFTHERSLLEHLRAAPWNFDQSLFKACTLARATCRSTSPSRARRALELRLEPI